MKFSEDVGQKGPAGGKKHLPSGAKSAPVLLAPNAMRWGKKHMVVGQKAHGVGAKGTWWWGKRHRAFCPCASCPTACNDQHHFMVKSFFIEMRHSHNDGVHLKCMQHISCGMSPLPTDNWITVGESFKDILVIKCQNFDDAELEFVCQLVASYHSKMLSISKCGSMLK